MADNFLERRMDDYRSGKLAAPKSHKPRPMASGAAQGAIDVKFEPCSLFVDVKRDSHLLATLLTYLVSAGCRVTFTLPADTELSGNRLAQSSGSMYVPSSQLHRLEQLRPEGFDRRVAVGDGEVTIECRKVTFLPTTEPDSVACAVMFLLAPLPIEAAQIDLR